MSKFVPFLALVLILTPCIAGAVSDEQWGYAREIGQRWVDQHNDKLDALVKQAAKQVPFENKDLIVASRHLSELSKTALNPETASDYGIPDNVANSKGVTFGLMKLYRTRVLFVQGGEQEFLTAEYFDDLDSKDSSSDIYMKIGHKYFLFFHGEGYQGCAKIIWLDSTENNAPVFFDIGQYGGGSQVEKTLYILDKNAVAAIPQVLFDSPETIRVKDYIQEKLKLTVWLSGETSYQDVAKDGTVEILNLSQVVYPEDLVTKLKQKYGFVNTDFIKPFRKALSVYQWNDKKQKMDDIGDYYY